MTGILLAGMVDKEAAAIEIMVGMYWRERTCVTLGRSPGLSMPRPTQACAACDLCIVDLFGLGMRRYSEEHEQRLLEFLGGRPAVLLVRGLESGWMERVLHLAAGQQVQCLLTPYNAQSLRETIGKLLQSQAALPDARPRVPTQVKSPSGNAPGVDALIPVPSKAAVAAPLPAWRRAEELAKRLQLAGNRPVASTSPSVRMPPQAVDRSRQHAPLTAPTTVAPPPNSEAKGLIKGGVPPALYQQAGAMGLGRGAMDALLAMFPSLLSLPIVTLGMKIVTSKGPQLLKAQPDTEIVLSFRQGWLVSSLSAPELRKLALTPYLANFIHVVHLPEQHVEDLVRQRFNGRFRRAQTALDELTWHLFDDAIRGQTLVPTGDMRIQLRRFPNITALGDATSLDIQLATICACAPHNVSDLLRAFPRQEQAVLRFVVLATASGLMSVITQDAPNTPAQQMLPTAASPEKSLASGPQVRAQRSFFKSLLEKLF